METEINSYSVLADSPQSMSKASFQQQQKYNKAMSFCRGLPPKLKTLKVQNEGKKVSKLSFSSMQKKMEVKKSFF